MSPKLFIWNTSVLSVVLATITQPCYVDDLNTETHEVTRGKECSLKKKKKVIPKEWRSPSRGARTG